MRAQRAAGGSLLLSYTASELSAEERLRLEAWETAEGRKEERGQLRDETCPCFQMVRSVQSRDV